MTETITGWLFDLYPNETNLTVWLIGEEGRRQRFFQDFAAVLYAAGPSTLLRQLWKWLMGQPIPVHLSRQERRDVFHGTIPVLSVEVLQPGKVDQIFREMVCAFPELSWYDADISIPLRYMARFDVFPLARVRLELRDETILRISPLDTPWELDPVPAPLRMLSLEPDCDPAHGETKELVISYERVRYSLPLEKAAALLVSLRADLRHYDPDVILTCWGDAWLLPRLAQASTESGVALPLNRDESQPVLERKEHTYFSYGQIVYRGRQTQLRGRWHLDQHNATLWGDYGMQGVLEMARVTRQPVQEAARLSPGTGISSMQFITALQRGILIPWHKHQAETPKSAMDLLRSDMGGLVYQPTVGLHREVGGVDFVSMYPGIMVRFNISPEVPRAKNDLEPTEVEPGIVPLTLAPLLNRRLALKSALLSMGKYDCRRPVYQALASAEKWLLVTCFGYLGYKNARFGRIEAHEAVTAYGREALLQAKEAAEQLGFTVLHMYVDGMWVKKDGASTTQDFQPVLDAILERTGLPISLDGVYRWVAFLPSRRDARIPVPNRYFGVFQDGTLKMRGIEARRQDTIPFIARTQLEMLLLLGRAGDAGRLEACLPELAALLRRRLRQMYSLSLPLEDFLVTLRVSRKLEEFRVPSPAALATVQLAAIGKTLRPGQHVRLLLTRGEPGVHAWDLPYAPPASALDLERYRVLLLRAAATVLQPLGLPEDRLESFIADQEHQSLLPGMRQAMAIAV